jgi:serine/threonine protein kinase
MRHLQSALFGGVYEARGLSSGRDFAVKVLHKSELAKAEEANSIEFCEVPLSEIRFTEAMRGDEHIMETEEHFEDTYCFYIIFALAKGGDLLEALKLKPHGFEELHAQYYIRQAAQGLAVLHKRRVAMQDVSLENMLLHVDEASGNYVVKICDPGQATVFQTDQKGKELPVAFRGLVGKSFRPPELHEQQPYCAMKVDSWCLGWSTFYLLTDQALFTSADPAQQDPDFQLLQQGDYATLFERKSCHCSHAAFDFIIRLLQVDPSKRMSVTEALEHAWLRDARISPLQAPEELLPESVRRRRDEPAQQLSSHHHRSSRPSPSLGHSVAPSPGAGGEADIAMGSAMPNAACVEALRDTAVQCDPAEVEILVGPSALVNAACEETASALLSQIRDRCENADPALGREARREPCNVRAGRA